MAERDPKYIPFLPRKRPENKVKIVRPMNYKYREAEKPSAAKPKPKLRPIHAFAIAVIIFIPIILIGASYYVGVIQPRQEEMAQIEANRQNIMNQVEQIRAQDQQADQQTNTPQTNTNTGSGYCSTDADCAGFGSRNCQGSANARCGSDKLCHCCLTLCYEGGSCSCISCSNGCSGGTYCEKDACVFSTGGKTSN